MFARFYQLSAPQSGAPVCTKSEEWYGYVGFILVCALTTVMLHIVRNYVDKERSKYEEKPMKSGLY